MRKYHQQKVISNSGLRLEAKASIDIMYNSNRKQMKIKLQRLVKKSKSNYLATIKINGTTSVGIGSTYHLAVGSAITNYELINL